MRVILCSQSCAVAGDCQDDDAGLSQLTDGEIADCATAVAVADLCNDQAFEEYAEQYCPKTCELCGSGGDGGDGDGDSPPPLL